MDNYNFEYKIEVTYDKRGTANTESMTKILKDYSSNGWRLVTVYTNELGKMQCRLVE